jgi:hypothetical protein
MYVNYRGGAYSRPGTRFVNYSGQTSRKFPPRLIPFQFSINQGLILEFGNFYMRVVSDGSLVGELPIPITNVTQADPGVVTAAATSGTSATAINTGVTSSYNTGDAVTFAGGSFSDPARITVTSTILLSAAVNAPGHNYAPAETISLAGGTFSTAGVVTISTTQLVSATIAAAGTGGTPGNATVIGTTGTGTKFQVAVTINAGGGITSINSIVTGGSYTVNPTSLGNEPVTGGGLVGAQLSVTMGVQSVFVSTGGSYTVNSANLTQSSSSGIGTGATFQSAFFGILTLSFVDPGVYTTHPANPISQASTNGTGLGVQFNATWGTGTANGLKTGDWVFIFFVEGMTQLNGQTFIINVLTPTTFQLLDVFGNPVNTGLFNAYIGGGQLSRIFTLPTIYSEADLEYLKFVQSADVMTICCVNQVTGTEYPPQDLARISDTDWTFTPVVPKPTIAAPFLADFFQTFSPGVTGPFGCSYAYQATAFSRIDGTESVASNTNAIAGLLDIAVAPGTNSLFVDAVPNAAGYNFYKAEPSYSGIPPAGVLFGFIGSSVGTSFNDTNIIPDFQQVPPTHQNPFARGQILAASPLFTGAGYTFANVIINTSTGSGAVIEAIVTQGGVAGYLVVDNGMDYAPTDTATVTGDGSGAAVTITIGPQTGTYPSVPNYFQQRRVFGNSLNNPDTYWMSQPGAFTNFDARIPTIASDAITGSPWALQVNGIQWFVIMPAGLATFTGQSAWLLVGSGSFATNVQPISPSSQVAQPLAFSGCSATLPPIKINYDILYVSSKGSYYYDLPYQLYALSEPIDLTNFSSHLFDFFSFREHTWAETPFKIVWTVRSDNTLLSLTYLKQQTVAGWGRHDTNGLFWSVASIVENVIATPQIGLPTPKADAVYFITERMPG